MASIFTIVVVSLSILSVLTKLLERGPKLKGKPLPWAGTNRVFLAELRDNLATAFTFKPLLESTYHKYAKNGHAVRVPNLQGTWIQFPPSLLNYLTSNPDHIFDALAANENSSQMKYTIPIVSSEAWLPIEIVRKYMPRKLSSLTADIMDELRHASDDQWGTDPKIWQEVPLFATCMNIFARASNRLIVGKEICQNPDYIARCSAYSGNLLLTGAIIRCFPKWTRPVTGRIIALPIRIMQRRIFKHLNPIIERRLADMKRAEQDLDFAREYGVPNDYMQWDLLHGESTNKPHLQTNTSVGARILMMNIIMLHTSTHTVLNTILDVLSHPDAGSILKDLRQEATEALVTPKTGWTRETIDKHLPKLDSVIRESMRLHPLVSRGITRTVASENGVTLPDSDLFVPYQSDISMNVYCIQRDPDNYENPNSFDPYRSYNHNNKLAKAAQGKDGNIGGPTKQPLSMVSPTPTFLSFGYGRHACPGRFLAAQEIKIMMVYVLINYDFKPIEGPRPPNFWVGDLVTPPLSANIMIKRREVEPGMEIPMPGVASSMDTSMA